ncbi:MAG: hypothetical protein J1F11_01535 [Oscillospiraceae bacterium]|nr:hypothetical protein [Oscillospiraceae bacterium]
MKGLVKPIEKCTEKEISAMYALMTEFYDNMDEDVFRRDFSDKDYCLVLYDEETLVGFTTQKVMSVTVDGREIHGMFSGDTIIHKDHWGEIELFKVWANFWFDYAEKYGEFYWFLICKGYKTYRILPAFWKEFYPNRQTDTPEYEQKIINAYASLLYPEEYNPDTGVIEYKHVKDKLRSGVADVDSHRIKNKDIAFFCNANPGHTDGNDLACLARIDKGYLKKRVPELLFR